jgi:excisionase family DNA binding protein
MSATDIGSPTIASRPTIEQALQLPPTVSVEQAAAILGISRTAAYEAIHRGEVQSFSIGRRIVVPTAPLLVMLGLGPSSLVATKRSTDPSAELWNAYAE